MIYQTQQHRRSTSRKAGIFQRLCAHCRLAWKVHYPLAPFLGLIRLVCLFLFWIALSFLFALVPALIFHHPKNISLDDTILKYLPLLAVLGGAITFLSQIFIYLWQTEQGNKNQRIDRIMKIADEFDRPEMQATRVRSAQVMQVDQSTQSNDIDGVLNFFEEIGFLLFKKAIDIDVVYEFFDYWITPYDQLTKEYRKKQNKDSDFPDFYCNFDKMVGLLTDYKTIKQNYTQDWIENRLKNFLAEESRIGSNSDKLERFLFKRAHFSVILRGRRVATGVVESIRRYT